MIELCTGLGVACVSHRLFRNNRSMFLLVMTQVRMDCSWPVNVRVARSSGALRAIEGASQGLTRIVLEPPDKVIHDFANDNPCGLKGLAWNSSAQGDKVGYEMDVRLQGRQKFRFEPR